MPRSFWLSGLVCLGFAFILSFLAAVSMPLLSGLDVVRVQFGNRATSSTPGVYQIRVCRSYV